MIQLLLLKLKFFISFNINNKIIFYNFFYKFLYNLNI